VAAGRPPRFGFLAEGVDGVTVRHLGTDQPSPLPTEPGLSLADDDGHKSREVEDAEADCKCDAAAFVYYMSTFVSILNFNLFFYVNSDGS